MNRTHSLVIGKGVAVNPGPTKSPPQPLDCTDVLILEGPVGGVAFNGGLQRAHLTAQRNLTTEQTNVVFAVFSFKFCFISIDLEGSEGVDET